MPPGRLPRRSPASATGSSRSARTTRRWRRPDRVPIGSTWEAGRSCPGFVDSHFHFLGFSFDRQRARLDRAASVGEVQRLVAVAAETGRTGRLGAGSGLGPQPLARRRIPQPPRPRRARPAAGRSACSAATFTPSGRAAGHWSWPASPPKPRIRPAGRSCASRTAPRAASCWSPPASACAPSRTDRPPRRPSRRRAPPRRR